MFPVPIVPGTLPLVGHRVTSSHNKSSAPVGLHRYSTLATRTCAQGGRAAAHHGCTRGIACARRAHAHTQACAALGPSLPVVLLRHGDCSMEKTDREAWRWKNCSNQKGIREAGDSAKSETGIFFLDGEQIEEWSYRA